VSRVHDVASLETIADFLSVFACLYAAEVTEMIVKHTCINRFPPMVQPNVY